MAMLSNIIERMKSIRKDMVMLIVANHCDILTYYAQKKLKLPPAQVIGTGTYLDSIRLRGLLAEKSGVCHFRVLSNLL